MTRVHAAHRILAVSIPLSLIFAWPGPLAWAERDPGLLEKLIIPDQYDPVRDKAQEQRLVQDMQVKAAVMNGAIPRSNIEWVPPAIPHAQNPQLVQASLNKPPSVPNSLVSPSQAVPARVSPEVVSSKTLNALPVGKGPTIPSDAHQPASLRVPSATPRAEVPKPEGKLLPAVNPERAEPSVPSKAPAIRSTSGGSGSKVPVSAADLVNKQDVVRPQSPAPQPLVPGGGLQERDRRGNLTAYTVLTADGTQQVRVRLRFDTNADGQATRLTGIAVDVLDTPTGTVHHQFNDLKPVNVALGGEVTLENATQLLLTRDGERAVLVIRDNYTGAVPTQVAPPDQADLYLLNIDKGRIQATVPDVRAVGRALLNADQTRLFLVHDGRAYSSHGTSSESFLQVLNVQSGKTIAKTPISTTGLGAIEALPTGGVRLNVETYGWSKFIRTQLEYDDNGVLWLERGLDADGPIQPYLIQHNPDGTTITTTPGTINGTTPTTPPVPAGTVAPGFDPARGGSLVGAATQAAARDLGRLTGQAGPVVLIGLEEKPLERPIPGVRGYYQGTIQGTARTVWGLVGEGGQIISSGLARQNDPPAVIPAMVQDLAKLWAGQRESFPFWALANQIIAPHQLEGDISEDIRVGLLNGILDMVSQTPARQGYGFADPFTMILRDLTVSDANVAAVVSRIVRELDLSDPAAQAGIGALYRSIATSLSVRAEDQIRQGIFRQGSGEYTQTAQALRSLVDTVTAADRSDHAAFSALLSVVADYHLHQRTYDYKPAYAEQRPEHVLTMLQQWVGKHGVGQATPQMASVAYELSFHLNDPQLAATSRAIARDIAESLITQLASTQGSAAFKVHDAVMIFQDTRNVEGFNALRSGLRQELVEQVLEKYSAMPTAQYQDVVLRFMALVVRHGDIEDSTKAQVVQFLGQTLERHIADFLALPAGQGGASPENLSTLTMIAKAIDRQDVVTPLLDRAVTKFPGSQGIPVESDDAFAARKARLVSWWQRYGMFVMDRTGVFASDPGLMDSFERFFEVAAPSIRHATHFIDITDAGGWRASQDGSVHLELQPFRPDESSNINYRRQSIINTLAHETGHTIHRSLPLDLDSRWRALYARSDVVNYQTDFVPTNLQGYASTNYAEDAGESINGWYQFNATFLNTAVDLAKQGKTVLLEKYLFWASYFARPGDGGETYPMYQKEVIERDPSQGGTEVRYVPTGVMTITSRDEEGRITRMTDGQQLYAFTYQGGQLTQVSREPVAGAAVRPQSVAPTSLQGQPRAPIIADPLMRQGGCEIEPAPLASPARDEARKLSSPPHTASGGTITARPGTINGITPQRPSEPTGATANVAGGERIVLGTLALSQYPNGVPVLPGHYFVHDPQSGRPMYAYDAVYVGGTPENSLKNSTVYVFHYRDASATVPERIDIHRAKTIDGVNDQNKVASLHVEPATLRIVRQDAFENGRLTGTEVFVPDPANPNPGTANNLPGTIKFWDLLTSSRFPEEIHVEGRSGSLHITATTVTMSSGSLGTVSLDLQTGLVTWKNDRTGRCVSYTVNHGKPYSGVFQTIAFSILPQIAQEHPQQAQAIQSISTILDPIWRMAYRLDPSRPPQAVQPDPVKQP